MLDLTWTVQVKQAETVEGKEHLPLPVGLRARTQADGQSTEGFADIPGLVAEGVMRI